MQVVWGAGDRRPDGVAESHSDAAQQAQPTHSSIPRARGCHMRRRGGAGPPPGLPHA